MAGSGPLFWPFAIDDIYDYAIWADGTGFWNYGYPDIYAAIFAPYGPDDLAAYAGPSPFGRRHRRVASLQQLCGDDRSDMAGPAIDPIAQAIQPNEAQQAALSDLAKALIPGCPDHSGLVSEAHRVHGAGAIGRHAAAHRHDDHGGASRAAAARKLL